MISILYYTNILFEKESLMNKVQEMDIAFADSMIHIRETITLVGRSIKYLARNGNEDELISLINEFLALDDLEDLPSVLTVVFKYV